MSVVVESESYAVRQCPQGKTLYQYEEGTHYMSLYEGG